MLRTDEQGVIADIELFLARGKDGRFFSSTGRGEITIWSQRGEYVRTLGRSGSGPGEFQNGSLSIHADEGGGLVVRDRARWSLYSQSLEILGVLGAGGPGGNIERSTLLEDGILLSADPSGERPEFYFHIFDLGLRDLQRGTQSRGLSVPGLVRSFGQVPSTELAPYRAADRRRLISYAGRQAFWAGPPNGTGRGYELELWSTDGTKLRTIRRDVPWFAPSSGRGNRGADQRQRTQITGLHVDSLGVIYVLASASRDVPRPAASSSLEQRQAAQRAATDIYIEVIDSESGTLLASTGALSYDAALAGFPYGFFRRSRDGYRRADAADGRPGVEIVSFRLVPK